MDLRSTLGTAATLAVLLITLAMLFGQILGQPILLGFVETGSMSPTLEAGDGFVPVPPLFAGDISEGDVITYNAQEFEGGGLTTHRVVDVTDEGYITKGDANPFTDQDSDEPPVTDAQVQAVALQVNGEVVRIPHLGTVALMLQGVVAAIIGFVTGVLGIGSPTGGGVGRVMVGLGVGLLVLSIVLGGRSDRRDGSRSRSRNEVISAWLALGVILLLITVPVVASMALPSGTDETIIVTSESPSEDPTVIEVESSQDTEYTASNNGFLPRLFVLDPASDGVTVEESVLAVSRGDEVSTTVTLHAADETGTSVRVLSQQQYIQMLPPSVIVALHRIHPFVAMGAITLAIAALVTLVFVLAVGLQPISNRDTSREASILTTVRRWFR